RSAWRAARHGRRLNDGHPPKCDGGVQHCHRGTENLEGPPRPRPAAARESARAALRCGHAGHRALRGELEGHHRLVYATDAATEAMNTRSSEHDDNIEREPGGPPPDERKLQNNFGRGPVEAAEIAPHPRRRRHQLGGLVGQGTEKTGAPVSSGRKSVAKYNRCEYSDWRAQSRQWDE